MKKDNDRVTVAACNTSPSDPVQRQKHDDWIKSQRGSSSNQEQNKESSDTKKEEPQYTKGASYSRPLAFAVFIIISTVLMWNLGQ